MTSRFRALPLAMLALTCLAGCQDAVGRPRPLVGDILWRVEPGLREPYQWHGMPAVAGERVFFDVVEAIKAFDVHTGRELWSTVIRPEPRARSRSLVAQNNLVIASDPFGIVAFDQESGAIRWRVAPNDSLIQSQGAADSRAYYTGTRGGQVYALDIATGAILWGADMRTGTDWLASNIIGIAVSGDTLAITGIFRTDPADYRPQGFIAAADRRDGRLLWRYETAAEFGSSFSSKAAITAELVLQADAVQRQMIALDRYTGAVRWIVSTDSYWGGPGAVPNVQDNVVYFGTHGGVAYAVDVPSGTVKWISDTKHTIEDVIPCGNYVFANNQAATVLDKRTGKQLRLVVAGEEDFLTSGFVVSGNRLFASGMVAVYALSCG